MKLSLEAKQAILMAIDDAMDTIREEIGKLLMDDGKGDCSCQMAHTGNCESNRQIVLEAPELEVSGSNPFEEIQAEIKQLKAQIERLAMQIKKRPDEEALDSINLKRIKETFLQVASDVITKEKI